MNGFGSRLKGRYGVALGYLTVVLIWGTTWYGVHNQVNGTAPHVAVALRLGAASLIFFAIARALGLSLRIDRRQIGLILVQGALWCGVNFIAVYTASQYLTSGVVAVLFSINVPFNIVAERLMNGTKPRLSVTLAALTGIVGIALVFSGELETAFRVRSAVWGAALAVFAAASVAVGNVVATRVAATDFGGIRQNAYCLGVGTLTILLWGALSGAPWTLHVTPVWLLSYAYLVLVGTVVAFTIYIGILPVVGSVAAAYIVVISPVVAIGLSVLLEGLRLGPITLAGVALLLVGQSILAMQKR